MELQVSRADLRNIIVFLSATPLAGWPVRCVDRSFEPAGPRVDRAFRAPNRQMMFDLADWPGRLPRHYQCEAL
tara:strand:- start:13028 stop:13246 length:219 start_codon:yes stop_codon:yes gene_type:complete